MGEVIIISLYFIIPIVLIYLAKKFPILDKIGVVVLSYGSGFLIAFSGILPEGFAPTQDILSTILIPLAIPLLLFSTDMKAMRKLTDKFVVSLLIGLFAIIFTVSTGYYFFMDNVADGNKIAGLLTGIYTGGTPNLASIKTALNVDSSTYLLVHSTDLVIGAFQLLFLMTFAKPLLSLILPAMVDNYDHHIETDMDVERIDILADFSYGRRKKSVIVMSLSVLVFAFGGGLSLLFPAEYTTTVAILSITTLSILISFYKPVNRIKHSFSIGMYLILVFSVLVASMVDLSMVSFESLNLVYYIAWAMFGTFIIQVLLSRLFKINADITIVTATALSMSPPFVPVIAAALKNKSIITPGIVIGLIGYIIGNYLGVLISFVL